ncbi:MAG: hypothetical protein NZ942_01315 [Candidatus Aenigmarchaeota archaeon]|nr:hypothetical protein [Candidatus Aenigmarchaeota archaeon]
MVSDEATEEVEIVPLSPIRRLERRIEQLEASLEKVDGKGILKEVIEIVRINQQLVDELAKANDALRIEISKLPARLDELIENLNELLNYIKASAPEETQPSFKPLTEKIEKLIEQNQKIIENNQSVLNVLSEISEKLKRPVIARPTLPVKPLKV